MGGAIIADKKGDRFFVVGAALPGGIILDEVYAEKVVLLRNGRQETLKMLRDVLDGDTGKGTLARLAPDQVRGGKSRPDPGASPTTGFLSGNPGGINKAIRIRPLYRGGKVQGFRISPGRNRKVFSQMGFRAGDVLTKINDVAPMSPKEVFSVLNQLQESGPVTVEITRRGRPVTLELKAP